MAVGGEIGYTGAQAAVPGFDAAGVAAGIKPTGDLDMSVIASPTPCTVAATFTQCKFPAAPVLYDKQVVDFNPSGIHGVVVNSGCANACTGPEGMANARVMAETLEKAIGSGDSSTLVMSTGVIGVQLPMDRIRAGVPAAVDKLKPEGWHDAARGIMTTDTFPKLYTGGVALDGEEVRISGISKGAGMIHPDMATMLSVMTTNAAVTAPVLQEALSAAVRKSFNCISVDGDTSTNDTVLLLANGQGSAPVIDKAEGPLWDAFLAGLTAASIELSRAIVRDGEGATKVVSIEVVGPNPTTMPTMRPAGFRSARWSRPPSTAAMPTGAAFCARPGTRKPRLPRSRPACSFPPMAVPSCSWWLRGPRWTTPKRMRPPSLPRSRWEYGSTWDWDRARPPSGPATSATNT